MAGQQAFLEILRAAGVQYIIGNPGTTELPLMDILPAYPDMHYRLTLHEGVAMAMADGYALASGTLGVLNVHVAPGLGNAMGMLHDCNNGQYLILKRRLHAYNGPAAKDQSYIGMDLVSPAIQFVDLARALGVQAECAKRPADLHQALQASMQRQGPTLIDVPLKADFPVIQGRGT
jgi:thiamine pyrophosphate-dependent acetolactate synthase large subunit-like protein